MTPYKVCILAAGPSRRVGDFSENVHKAVLPVGGKGVISHIIEKFPEDVEFVVAVGHRKDTVVDYLKLAYPRRRFTFVEIERYIGPGTGPGRSLLECKDHLRCPFVLCTADTIVGEPVPEPLENWFGLAPTTEPERFCTVKLDGGRITELRDKEKCDNTQAFIGLAGVKDWEKFFLALETNDEAKAARSRSATGSAVLVASCAGGRSPGSTPARSRASRRRTRTSPTGARCSTSARPTSFCISSAGASSSSSPDEKVTRTG